MTATGRTCVVCRSKEDKQSLLRFVLASSAESPGEALLLRLDGRQKMPGRGAYCHAALSCLLQRKAYSLLTASLKKSRSKKHLPAAPPKRSEAGEDIERLLEMCRQEMENLENKLAKGDILSAKDFLQQTKLKELQQKLYSTR